MTVSYYDRDAKASTGEQTPIYAMSFELYENGVSRALSLDYNDFVIGGVDEQVRRQGRQALRIVGSHRPRSGGSQNAWLARLKCPAISSTHTASLRQRAHDGD